MATRHHGLFRLCDRPSPDVAKGGCYFSGDAGPGVDTGILIEFEGTLYFSLQTIKELAEVAGYSLDEEALENERRIAEYEKQLTELRIVNGEMHATLNAVGIAVARAAAEQS